MPDQRGGMEGDLPVAVEDAPAKIDVVARDCVDGIEAAKLVQRRTPERHVASGNVLGQVVRQQHVNGAARGRRDLMRSWRIARRAFVWPAHADDVVLLESQREVV